jgi:hypothetical protein
MMEDPTPFHHKMPRGYIITIHLFLLAPYATTNAIIYIIANLGSHIILELTNAMLDGWSSKATDENFLIVARSM